MKVDIRPAIASDVPAMMALVRELALFEKAPEQVTNTESLMLQDGFGPNPSFYAFLATVNDEVVGLALSYIRYSTWKGRRLYLEDIIVTEQKRGLGLGKKLFDATIQLAQELKCTGMMWQVLDWNQSAIDFYAKYGTRFDEEWVNCHLDF